MQNEKQNNDPHNPQKKGESGAINKLNENEDENADDTCGGGSSHTSGSAQQTQTQGDIGHRRDPINPNDQNDDENPSADPDRQAAPAKQGQNAPPRMGQQRDQTKQGQSVLDPNRPARANEFSHNPNKQNDTANQGQNAQNQNHPGEETHESEDETAPENRLQNADARQADQQQKDQNLPRSRRQLGDPDDQDSAETRRKESAAEDAEKSGTDAASGTSQKNPIMKK